MMLKVLNVLIVFLIIFQVNKVQADELHAPYAGLLRRYVAEGRVDYVAIKHQRKILDDYLLKLSEVTKEEFDSWSQPDRLAYLINLYNAVTIQLVINNYPINSIKELSTVFQTPWEKRIVRFFGKIIDLDTLEHKIIRREYNEPRIHAALACAAKSCPPLRSDAYYGHNLHEQLENQSAQMLSNPKSMRVNHDKKIVYLTPIFKWYEMDFVSVKEFVEKHSNEDIDDYKIEWLEYDWSINEK